MSIIRAVDLIRKCTTLLLLVAITSLGLVSCATNPRNRGSDQLEYNSDSRDIRTRTSDDTAVHTVIARVAVGYDASDNSVFGDISQNKREIEEILRDYFSEQTAERLKSTDRSVLSAEMKQRINTSIMGGRIKDLILFELSVIRL